jgi:hypothetical protein
MGDGRNVKQTAQHMKVYIGKTELGRDQKRRMDLNIEQHSLKELKREEKSNTHS